MPAYRTIEVNTTATTTTIIFSRPAVLNALNNELITETLKALDALPESTRVLVLRGAGEKAFAAGGDLNEMQVRDTWTELDFGPRRELTRRLETSPFVTVAALNGLAMGGGLELALACHLRIASDSARFALPEIKLGIFPGNGGVTRLPRLIGLGRALQMILLAETITASEAVKIGLVNWSVSPDEFNAKLLELVGKLECLAPIARRAILDCVRRSVDLNINDSVANEHTWSLICVGSADKAEGVRAFHEKRTPHFQGR